MPVVEPSVRVETKLYLTAQDAADVLRLSVRTLERMRVEGTGPRYHKAGGGKRARVLYNRADLDDWLQGLSFNSTAEYVRGGSKSRRSTGRFDR